MKKFHLILALLMVVFSSLTASAYKLTFVVDDPSHVTIEFKGENVPLQAGENVFDDLNFFDSFTIRGVSPYVIDSITNSKGEEVSTQTPNVYYIYAQTNNNGEVYTIKTSDANNKRTDSFTLNVDDPTGIRAYLSGSNELLTLNSGANTVKYDPASENILWIYPANYQIHIYEVKCNGQVVDFNGTYYMVNLTNGCTVDITVKVPEDDVVVTFEYPGNGEGAIQSVTVNMFDVEDFDGKEIRMKAGQTLGLTANKMYKIESVYQDGKDIFWTGKDEYTTVIMHDTKFTVNAYPYQKVTAKIFIDDPDNIYVYRGYDYNEQEIDLLPGENTVEFSEDLQRVSWAPKPGGRIVSVTVDGSELSPEAYTLEVYDGMVIEFKTAQINYDKRAVIWIDDLSRLGKDGYFGVTDVNRTPIEFVSGYNTLKFADSMNPFSVSWTTENAIGGKMYVNGTLADPDMEGGNVYTLTLADMDVVKIFLASEPQTYKVTFATEGDVEVNVVRDLITEVKNWNSGFDCFQGTRVQITNTDADNKEFKVYINGDEMNYAPNGIYAFDVEADTEVKLSGNNAVDGIAADEADADAPVFNMMGVKVGTRAQLNNLPAGIYIVAGRKTVVK